MKPSRYWPTILIAAFVLALPVWSDARIQASRPQKVAPAHWVPTWTVSPTPNGKPEVRLTDQTLRQIVRVSAGGSSVRIRLSNAYGSEPLRIDDASVARRVSGSRIDVTSSLPLTFAGLKGVTIAPGAYVLSDAASIKVSADTDLAVSLYVSAPTAISTVHDNQRSAIYAAAGNVTASEALSETPSDLGTGLPWLVEVTTYAPAPVRAIIAFGDSITDGYGITPDKGGTWPEVLSHRLHAAGLNYSVVNAGISGNRLLHHGQWVGFGDGALSRFDRDVLAQPNVSDVIVLIGINDLGHAKGIGAAQYVSAEDIIGALTQLAVRAHERGLRIHASTLLPFKGTTFTDYYSDEKETQRLIVNAWIRNTKAFDSVIDFDKVMEDPARPGYLKAELDVGDHLHPNFAGAGVMGNAVPLDIFSKRR